MDPEKLKRLEAAGFRETSVQEVFGLTDEENAIIEIKLLLSAYLRYARHDAQISQVALAERIGSSQSRVAKAEHGDPSVSVDLLIKSILAAGATKEDIGPWPGRRFRRWTGRRFSSALRERPANSPPAGCQRFPTGTDQRIGAGPDLAPPSEECGAADGQETRRWRLTG
jgi:transcriptional regulator with XRE-family HTH domain